MPLSSLQSLLSEPTFPHLPRFLSHTIFFKTSDPARPTSQKRLAGFLLLSCLRLPLTVRTWCLAMLLTATVLTDTWSTTSPEVNGNLNMLWGS